MIVSFKNGERVFTMENADLRAHPINQGEDSFILQKIYTFVP